MAKIFDSVYTAALVLVLVLATFLGLKHLHEFDINKVNLFRQSGHLQQSVEIALGLSQCGVYPYNPVTKVNKPVMDLANTAKVTDAGTIDCKAPKFAVAADMGYSLLLAAAMSLGQMTSLDITTSLFLMKMFIIVAVWLLLSTTCGKTRAALVTVALSVAVVLLQKQMFGPRLLTVNHNYTWLIYIFAVLSTGCTIFRTNRNWFLILLSAFLVGFVSLIRVGDFYLIISGIILTSLLFAARERFQNVGNKLLTSLMVIVGILSVHLMHEHYVKSRMDQGLHIHNHAVIHPIILGLGQPETPFSREHHFKWADGDTITLKLAQQINPDVRVMYSKEFNQALLSLYINSWLHHPLLMIKSYYLKATSLLGGNKSWIYLLLACSAVIFLLEKDYIGLFFCIAATGKIIETIMIFPTPYWVLYHQYIPAMVSILIIFASLSAARWLKRNVPWRSLSEVLRHRLVALPE